MVDLETLDTSPNAVILTLGAVKFDPKSNFISDETLSIRFSIEDQTQLGRTISDSTLEWWANQPKETQDIAFSDDGRISVVDAVEQFHRFVWGAERIWSQGSFDINILENLYRSLQRPFSWSYWQIRDSRTLFDFVDGELDRSQHHDALQDAIAQAKGVQTALKKIGWKGKRL